MSKGSAPSLLDLLDSPHKAHLKQSCFLHQVIHSLVCRSCGLFLPSAASWFQLSCNKLDRLSCRTWVTFSGALMLNTAHWCHCRSLSELTVLSRAGPHIYILYSHSLQTFNFALILNPFSVNFPRSLER